MGKKIIIIGNSAAALGVLNSISKGNGNYSVEIVSKEYGAAYSRVLLPYYISDRIGKENLFIRDKDFYKSKNCVLTDGCEVVRIEPKKNILHTSNGKKKEFDKLVIATGGLPNFPNIKGVELKGVFGIRDIEDAEELKKNVAGKKSAVFIGGGLISIQTAKALRELGLEITVIISSNRVLSQILNESGAKIIEREVKWRGFKIKKNSNVSEIVGKEYVESVRLESGEEIGADCVIVGKGVVPNANLIKGSGIKKDWGIIVDNQMRTNVENIFAAGDVAQVQDVIEKDKSYCYGTWPEAVFQGEIAGSNIIGVEKNYDGGLSMNTYNLYDWLITSIGKRNDEDAEDLTIKKKDVYRKFLLKENKLIGATIVERMNKNLSRDIGLIQMMIRKRMDVRFIEKFLRERILNIGDFFICPR